MRPTVFQKAELRDENDNIIQQGTYGKGSALSNSTNDAWIDYVMNNLEALRSMSVGAVIPVETLPESGETGKAYVVTTGTDAGKLFMWDGEDWVEITGSIGDYLPITGGTITGNLAVEGISTAVTPNADDNSTKVATTEYVQNEVKPIETDVDIAEKDIANIKALLQGHLYDYQTDSSSAYTKSVPAGAMPYAGLEQIGGKTVVWNQLAPTGYSKDSNGSTAFSIGTQIVAGHKYYVHRTLSVSVASSIGIFCRVGGTSTNSFNIGSTYTSVIATALASGISDGTHDLNEGNCWIYQNNIGNTVTQSELQITDLTLLYGAGNEPSTVAEHEAIFPSVYSYEPGSLLSAGVTSVVSKDSNDSTLQTYPIPTAIRNLEGYGWSAGSVSNYIDFERKVFVQNVGAVDMGNINWIGYDSVNQTFWTLYANWATPMKTVDSQPPNIICYKYPTIIRSYLPDNDKVVVAIKAGYLSVKDSSFGGNLNDFITAMSGVTLYYELATPVETDISEYLTDDNLINVEAGGTLTFPNQNGTNYQIPAPSEETYMIDLQEAIQ